MQNAECRIENAANAEQASFCILHSCAGANDDRHDARARARPPSLPPASLRGPRAAARGFHARDVALPDDGNPPLRRRAPGVLALRDSLRKEHAAEEEDLRRQEEPHPARGSLVLLPEVL